MLVTSEDDPLIRMVRSAPFLFTILAGIEASSKEAISYGYLTSDIQISLTADYSPLFEKGPLGGYAGIANTALAAYQLFRNLGTSEGKIGTKFRYETVQGWDSSTINPITLSVVIDHTIHNNCNPTTCSFVTRSIMNLLSLVMPTAVSIAGSGISNFESELGGAASRYLSQNSKGGLAYIVNTLQDLLPMTSVYRSPNNVGAIDVLNLLHENSGSAPIYPDFQHSHVSVYAGNLFTMHGAVVKSIDYNLSRDQLPSGDPLYAEVQITVDSQYDRSFQEFKRLFGVGNTGQYEILDLEDPNAVLGNLSGVSSFYDNVSPG